MKQDMKPRTVCGDVLMQASVLPQLYSIRYVETS